MDRSRYLGVYNNKYKPTLEEFPFRVAVKQYINGTPRYKNVGFFKTEETAANIFNIHALNMFGSGAIINDVPLDPETKKEMQDYFDNVYNSEYMLKKAKQILLEHRELLQVYNKV